MVCIIGIAAFASLASNLLIPPLDELLAGADAALTLTDGSKVPWTKATSVLVGNRTIMASEVAKLYGSRDGSIDIDCVGV
jgi:hypothetical protein